MVVLVMRVCLAIGTEIEVVANGALITGALDILGLVLTEWTVAEDANVAGFTIAWSRDWLK
jgi:hypothetical protein